MTQVPLLVCRTSVRDFPRGILEFPLNHNFDFERYRRGFARANSIKAYPPITRFNDSTAPKKS